MKIPEGWPTEEMLNAGVGEFWNGYSRSLHIAVSLHKAFKAMLAVAPEPPEQEDEPFAWVYEFNDPDPQMDIEFQKEKPTGWPGNKCYPLYTRPDSSSLRKAAGDLFGVKDMRELGKKLEILRSELEK